MIRLAHKKSERQNDMLDRLASFVDSVSGCRITHEQLTKDKTWFDADSIESEA